MKKLLTSIAFVSISICAMAQSNYEKTMTSLVEQIEAVPVMQESYMPIANKMERVANAEADKWEAAYWMSYMYTIESFLKPSSAEKDAVLDIAQGYLDKAEKLSPNNDEIEVMKAQLATAKLSVDPQSRYMTYGAKFNDALEKAEKINPANPRTHYLRGTTLFYTPEGFGGGKEKALAEFKVAMEKFDNFKPKTAYMPKWGKNETTYFITLCQ